MKAGNYVRTKDGYIGNINNTDDKNIYKNNYLLLGKIIKSSPNIIDLIEVGDYVNGYKVVSLWKDKTKVIGVAVDSSVIGFDECEIKSIVTKEQFESMEYKVGE